LARYDSIAFGLTAAAAAAGLVSIAASQILLGLALAWLLAVRRQLKFPACAWALAAFLAWTLLSAALSPDPRAALPQIRKFYVWLAFPVVYTAVRSQRQARTMLTGIAVASTASALWSLVQFARKWQDARALHVDFYQHYVADRTTGFMSHWMTFGSHMTIALSILLAGSLWAWRGRARILGATATFAVAVALALGFTRSVWAGAAVACLILVWRWKRWLIALAPIALLLALAVGPAALRERVQSAWSPTAADSNLHRVALRETGWIMLHAKPIFGFGPEQIERNVDAYMPDLYKPIPKEWWYGHLHNLYLQYAAERGVPALAVFLLFVGWMLRDLLHATRHRDLRFTSLAAIASVAGILVGGWWELNLGDSEVLGLFLSVTAAALAGAKHPARS
jgi:O-antigen ligase